MCMHTRKHIYICKTHTHTHINGGGSLIWLTFKGIIRDLEQKNGTSEGEEWSHQTSVWFQSELVQERRERWGQTQLQTLLHACAPAVDCNVIVHTEPLVCGINPLFDILRNHYGLNVVFPQTCLFRYNHQCDGVRRQCPQERISLLIEEDQRALLFLPPGQGASARKHETGPHQAHTLYASTSSLRGVFHKLAGYYMVECPEDGRSASAWKLQQCTGFWTQVLVISEGKVVCSEFSTFIPLKDSQCGGLSNCGPYQWLCFLPQYAQQIGGATGILMPGICSDTQQAPGRQATNRSPNQCQQLSFRMVSSTALKNIINNKNKQTKNRVYWLSGNECYYTYGPTLFMSFNLHLKKNCPQTFMVTQCFLHTYYVLGMVTRAAT